LEFLCEYDFEIKHIEGKENKVVDALSRGVHEFHATTISMYQTDIKGRVLEATNTDLQYRKLVAKLQQGKTLQGVEDYKLGVDDILLYKNRVYVPNVQELKLMILNEMHNVPYAGHPGYQKIVVAVKSHYFWSSMKKDIAKHIQDVWSARRLKKSIGTQQGCYNLYPFLIGSGKW
jgi:hypothetical protein